jgi:hypothetical protein
MILISFDSVENVCLLSCIKVPKSTKPAKAFNRNLGMVK